MSGCIGDMIDAIHRAYEEEEDALNLMKELNNKFKNKELEMATREYAEDNSLCYDCECEMQVESWIERHPYGDTFANEVIRTKVCPECGEEL